MRQILAIFIANFAETQTNFVGISQIVQKMLQYAENLKKFALILRKNRTKPWSFFGGGQTVVAAEVVCLDHAGADQGRTADEVPRGVDPLEARLEALVDLWPRQSIARLRACTPHMHAEMELMLLHCGTPSPSRRW